VRDYLGYLFYRSAQALSMSFSRDQAYRIARRLASLAWRVQPSAREMLLANSRQVLGPQAPQSAVRSHARSGFNHWAYGLIDFLRLPYMIEGDLEDLIVKITGFDRVKESVSAGSGGILMIGHMGPWEAGGAWVGSQGVPLTAVALPHSGRVEEFFVGLRERSGYRTVPLGRGARELLRALGRGELVVVAADRNFTEFGTRVPFFNRTARLPDGHVRIALRTGAPIFPTLLIRGDDLRVHLIFEKPIYLQKGQDDVHSGMRRCLEVLADYIRRTPEQWVAFSPIWKNGE
jgi:lauroyl/myristoyl acyltransferase